MDVKTYYQRIRQTEAAMATQFVVVQSLATDDGGKARRTGRKCPVTWRPRWWWKVQAVVASETDTATFRLSQEAAFKSAQEASVASRLEVTMVPSDELKKLTEDMKKMKSGAKAAKD